MDKNFFDAISRLIEIEEKLEKVGQDLLTLCDSCIGPEFPEQQQLAIDLEKRIESIGHETASEIGFQRNMIVMLHTLIQFRKVYSCFTDGELEQIIDSGMPDIHVVKEVSSKFGDKAQAIDKIKQARNDWNSEFKSMSYKKVKEKLGIS